MWGKRQTSLWACSVSASARWRCAYNGIVYAREGCLMWGTRQLCKASVLLFVWIFGIAATGRFAAPLNARPLLFKCSRISFCLTTFFVYLRVSEMRRRHVLWRRTGEVLPLPPRDVPGWRGAGVVRRVPGTRGQGNPENRRSTERLGVRR